MSFRLGLAVLLIGSVGLALSVSSFIYMSVLVACLVVVCMVLA